MAVIVRIVFGFLVLFNSFYFIVSAIHVGDIQL